MSDLLICYLPFPASLWPSEMLGLTWHYKGREHCQNPRAQLLQPLLFPGWYSYLLPTLKKKKNLQRIKITSCNPHWTVLCTMSEAGRASSSFSGSLFILTTLTGDIQFRMSQSVSYYTHHSTVLTCVLQKEPVLRQIRKKH